MDLNAQLICASAASYAINPQTGSYTPETFYEPKVCYTNTPIAFSNSSSAGGDLINACLVGMTATEIIVAFRGTIFGESVASLEDWLQNFQLGTTTAPDLPGAVHKGFYDAVASLYGYIVTQVKAFQAVAMQPGIPVYVTGHSKGGGMAPIFAYLMHAKDGITAAQVVTFAAPLSGDAAFASAYDSVFANHARYENFGDLVPMLPPTTDFITWFVQEIGPYKSDIPTWFYDDIVNAETWDYTAVGTEYYIWPKILDYYISTGVSVDIIVPNIAANIVAYEFDLEAALLSAHTVQCGHGYFSGIVPSITQCPSPTDDAAALPKVAPPKHDPVLKSLPA